jgi:hypothetical protein
MKSNGGLEQFETSPKIVPEHEGTTTMTKKERAFWKQYLRERSDWSVADWRIETKVNEFILQEMRKVDPGMKPKTMLKEVFPREHEFWNRLYEVLCMAQRDENSTH